MMVDAVDEGQKAWDEVTQERETGEKIPVEAAVEPPIEQAADPEPVEVVPDPVAELKAQVAQLTHRANSADGRVEAMRREQAEAVEAAKKAATQVKEAPTASEVKAAIENPAQWDALKEDFPEWAAATEALLDSRLSKVGGLDPAAIQAIVTEQVKGQTDAVRGEIIDSALDAVFPGWKEEVNTEAFGAWLNAQSDEIKALGASSKVGDAAKMLRQYEASKAPSVTASITQQRQTKLDAAASAPTKTAGKSPGPKAFEDMTPAEQWEFEAKQRAKKQQSY